MTPIRIPGWFQGPTGQGQGGWTASRLAARMDGPATVRLCAPVPLDQDLDVRAVPGGLNLVDGVADRVLMEARNWRPSFPDAAPVSVEAAAAARVDSAFLADRHPAPDCFSCGVGQGAMGVHPGMMDDGRVATDWRPPRWAVDDGGRVDSGVLWAALDCVSGFYVSADGAVPMAFTAQYAVEALAPLDPDKRYAIVAWAGDAPAAWDGRKRRAAAAAFDDDGRVVGRAASFWVAARA